MAIREVHFFTIPHNDQRYDTIGDWIVEGVRLTLYGSELGNWRMTYCAFVHEAVEAALCDEDGIDQSEITQFDELYEERRQYVLGLPGPVQEPAIFGDELHWKFHCNCIPTLGSEPGEDRHAPYRLQHAFADGIERLFANALGVVWSEYQEKVENLVYAPTREVNHAGSQAPQGGEQDPTVRPLGHDREEGGATALGEQDRAEGDEPPPSHSDRLEPSA